MTINNPHPARTLGALTRRPPPNRPVPYEATLSCGTTLLFEFRQHLPALGSAFPCREPGHSGCTVIASGERQREPAPPSPAPGDGSTLSANGHPAPAPAPASAPNRTPTGRATALTPDIAARLVDFLTKYPGTHLKPAAEALRVTPRVIEQAAADGIVTITRSRHSNGGVAKILQLP